MSDRRVRVAAFVSTRADLFPMLPVLEDLASQADLEVRLLASSAMRGGGMTDPLEGLSVPGLRVVWLAEELQGTDCSTMVGCGPVLARAMTEALSAWSPDTLLVLGDRWELLYVVPPAVLLDVPVVHLHGGEVTEGAIDDRVRHAITKLSEAHCVSTSDAARRVLQLGELPESVVVTGAPSLDRAVGVSPATDEMLVRLLGRAPVRPLALVTYHPVTLGGPDPGDGARAVLEAVRSTAGSAIVTHPGLDRGREQVLAEIRRAVAGNATIVDLPNLGPDYLSVLAAVDVVVGNSSSGILEAATFGVPVVDVGERQRGRTRGVNVVHAPEERDAIAAAVETALAPEFRRAARAVTNPYGDGRAAARVTEVVRAVAARGLRPKPFTDVAAGG